jgi:hypothetical protein
LNFLSLECGNAPAGPFQSRATLDPERSVIVDTPVPGGLAAGASTTIADSTLRGGNRFDPDCTIRVDADNNNAVSECDEGDNTLIETTPG